MKNRYEFNHVLARHYGLTEEELDFIINYDIKYRMGRETEEEANRCLQKNSA